MPTPLSHLKSCVHFCLILSFAWSSVYTPSAAYAQDLTWMPKPGVMVSLSPQFTPPLMKALIIHPENPLAFDFLMDQGDEPLASEQKSEEYQKLIKYFFASLTVPEQDLWVNLSPYEKGRIIDTNFGKTDMGRDLLAMDYVLKQITASLIYPKEGLGEEFWTKVYDQAQKQFGTTNVPINTFNKVKYPRHEWRGFFPR